MHDANIKYDLVTVREDVLSRILTHQTPRTNVQVTMSVRVMEIVSSRNLCRIRCAAHLNVAKGTMNRFNHFIVGMVTYIYDVGYNYVNSAPHDHQPLLYIYHTLLQIPKKQTNEAGKQKQQHQEGKRAPAIGLGSAAKEA